MQMTKSLPMIVEIISSTNSSKITQYTSKEKDPDNKKKMSVNDMTPSAIIHATSNNLKTRITTTCFAIFDI